MIYGAGMPIEPRRYVLPVLANIPGIASAFLTFTPQRMGSRVSPT